MTIVGHALLETRFVLDVSAASGLVVLDGIACVVADDGLHLHRYRLADGHALTPLALRTDAGAPAPLPKRTKPDLEALLDAGDGTLLAIGSGSRDNRERAFRIAPATGAVRTIDLSPLYAALRRRVGALNIEGAVRAGDHLVLANRRTGTGTSNALIRLDAVGCLGRDRWEAGDVVATTPIDLPALDGIALGFTDLAWHPGRGLHFLAAAEETDDPVLDGRCTGSVIGRFDEALRPAMVRLRPDVKLEGLAHADDAWWCVADADDPAVRSALYRFAAMP